MTSDSAKYIKILIIEDNPTWSIFIESIIADSEYKLIGAANTLAKAKAMIDGYKPDILISDIKIGNDIIFDFLATENYTHIPVVFMTNHLENEFYDLSHRLDKSSYLVKPFHKFTLLSTLELLISKYPVINSFSEQFITIIGNHKQEKKIMFDDIAWIEAEGNYTFVYTISGIKYARKKTLKQYFEELDARFIRVHRAFIINKNYVRRIDLSNREIAIGETTIPFGRLYRSELDSLL